MTESLTPGTVFAGYTLERVLGTGGMGTVFLARHPRLPRRDALKVLSESFGGDEEIRARFIREAELTAELDHPNVVTVYDRGVERDRLWIAMQLVDGIDAAELIGTDGSDLPPERALHIVTEAARGLDAAHRAGLLHRDVKPANILLESHPGEPERVYITDFGIAKALAQSTALTAVGSVLATLAYSAPEQLVGGAVDHRADVYALGCTLYELLTRAKPFPRTTAAAVTYAHLRDSPPHPTSANPALPSAIDSVTARAMAKDPDDRFASCGALADAAVAAFRAGGDEQTFVMPRPMRRRRERFAVAGLVAALVVAVVVTSVVVANRSERPPTARTPDSATSTVAPVIATEPAKNPRSWGAHSFIVQALPELLPPDPFSSGYQGLRCVPVDEDVKVVDVDQDPGKVGRISCRGNSDPVENVLVSCNANRTPIRAALLIGRTAVGDRRWESPRGRGRVAWAETRTEPNDPDGGDQPQGLLEVQFDDPVKNFCRLTIYGGDSAQDLYDRWWPTAPF
ncbi:serine/threonine-protein kinase [Nocardia aurea]|uniref:serine/threonine-protein kinase n=1 Tax=Nocardia aurea TaxID=2144174 RepID=UPI0033BE28F5